MCVGGLFGGGQQRAPAPPPRMAPAPPLRAPAPPAAIPTPAKIKDELDEEDDKLSTRKKKALEIKKVQQGVKQLGAIDPATMPETPAGGVSGL